MESLRIVDDMHSLQVVMTYATDYKYRLRCLPGFLPKKYLNNHIFDGVHRRGYCVNEIYVGHKKAILDAFNDISPRDQLYALFSMYGVDDTFSYLSTVARSKADMYLLHQSLYQSTYDPYNIGAEVEKSIDETLLSFSENKISTLDEIVSAITFDLLRSISVYMKKR